MANDKRKKAQDDIITAAIDCISELGISDTTVRSIANKANVNPAAISYYFGSRDELIAIALKITLDNAFDLSDLEIDEADDYRSVLKQVLVDWQRGALAYPGICHAHFDEVLNDRLNSSVVTDRLIWFIDKVYALLRQHGLEPSEKNHAKLKIIFGSFISSIIMPKIARPSGIHDNYINLLVEMI